MRCSWKVMIFQQLARQMWAGGGVDFHIARTGCVHNTWQTSAPGGSLSFSIEWVSLSNHPFCGDLDLHTQPSAVMLRAAAAAVTRLFALPRARSLSSCGETRIFSTVTQSATRRSAAPSLLFPLSLWFWSYACAKSPFLTQPTNKVNLATWFFILELYPSYVSSLPLCRFAAASPAAPRGQKKAEMHFLWCFLFLLPPRPQKLLHCEIFTMLFGSSLCWLKFAFSLSLKKFAALWKWTDQRSAGCCTWAQKCVLEINWSQPSLAGSLWQQAVKSAQNNV